MFRATPHGKVQESVTRLGLLLRQHRQLQTTRRQTGETNIGNNNNNESHLSSSTTTDLISPYRALYRTYHSLLQINKQRHNNTPTTLIKPPSSTNTITKNIRSFHSIISNKKHPIKPKQQQQLKQRQKQQQTTTTTRRRFASIQPSDDQPDKRSWERFYKNDDVLSHPLVKQRLKRPLRKSTVDPTIDPGYIARRQAVKENLRLQLKDSLTTMDAAPRLYDQNNPMKPFIPQIPKMEDTPYKLQEPERIWETLRETPTLKEFVMHYLPTRAKMRRTKALFKEYAKTPLDVLDPKYTSFYYRFLSPKRLFTYAIVFCISSIFIESQILRQTQIEEMFEVVAKNYLRSESFLVTANTIQEMANQNLLCTSANGGVRDAILFLQESLNIAYVYNSQALKDLSFLIDAFRRSIVLHYPDKEDFLEKQGITIDHFNQNDIDLAHLPPERFLASLERFLDIYYTKDITMRTIANNTDYPAELTQPRQRFLKDIIQGIQNKINVIKKYLSQLSPLPTNPDEHFIIRNKEGNLVDYYENNNRFGNNNNNHNNNQKQHKDQYSAITLDSHLRYTLQDEQNKANNNDSNNNETRLDVFFRTGRFDFIDFSEFATRQFNTEISKIMDYYFDHLPLVFNFNIEQLNELVNDPLWNTDITHEDIYTKNKLGHKSLNPDKNAIFRELITHNLQTGKNTLNEALAPYLDTKYNPFLKRPFVSYQHDFKHRFLDLLVDDDGQGNGNGITGNNNSTLRGGAKRLPSHLHLFQILARHTKRHQRIMMRKRKKALQILQQQRQLLLQQNNNNNNNNNNGQYHHGGGFEYVIDINNKSNIQKSNVIQKNIYDNNNNNNADITNNINNEYNIHTNTINNDSIQITLSNNNNGNEDNNNIMNNIEIPWIGTTLSLPSTSTMNNLYYNMNPSQYHYYITTIVPLTIQHYYTQITSYDNIKDTFDNVKNTVLTWSTELLNYISTVVLPMALDLMLTDRWDLKVNELRIKKEQSQKQQEELEQQQKQQQMSDSDLVDDFLSNNFDIVPIIDDTNNNDSNNSKQLNNKKNNSKKDKNKNNNISFDQENFTFAYNHLSREDYCNMLQRHIDMLHNMRLLLQEMGRRIQLDISDIKPPGLDNVANSSPSNTIEMSIYPILQDAPYILPYYNQAMEDLSKYVGINNDYPLIPILYQFNQHPTIKTHHYLRTRLDKDTKWRSRVYQHEQKISNYTLFNLVKDKVSSITSQDGGYYYNEQGEIEAIPSSTTKPYEHPIFNKDVLDLIKAKFLYHCFPESFVSTNSSDLSKNIQSCAPHPITVPPVELALDHIHNRFQSTNEQQEKLGVVVTKLDMCLLLTYAELERQRSVFGMEPSELPSIHANKDLIPQDPDDIQALLFQ